MLGLVLRADSHTRPILGRFSNLFRVQTFLSAKIHWVESTGPLKLVQQGEVLILEVCSIHSNPPGPLKTVSGGLELSQV